ncbi:MAG: LTA synthase family protein, partial [Bacteroidales bacterium]
IGIWVKLPLKCLNIYYRVVNTLLAVLLALIFVADTVLYSFWEFKLDGTVFNYISQPGGALQSVSPLYAAGVVAAFAITAAALWVVYDRFRPKKTLPRERRRVASSLLMLLCGGLLFLGIRGGVGRSTANVGMVYYSTDQFLNHAAVNPAFSLLSTLSAGKDYASECDFFEEEERRRLFKALQFGGDDTGTDSLLTTRRPNIVMILMEGCGATFVESLGGEPGVTPCLNALANEGVLFTQCYANSFRTDRGTLCALSGYPSFPDFSVMKQPRLSRRLPSIAASLVRAGYATEFLYGGDINFTKMKGYLSATGFETILGDTHFPLEVRRTHAWGVTDGIVLDTLFNHVIAPAPDGKPKFTVCLTLASHEPWAVPFEKFPDNKHTNAMAYLDDCIGRFVQRLRSTPEWSNTLLVLLPDHGIGYPEDITPPDPRRYHIPLLWAGGSLAKPMRYEKVCNQSDLAATLLAQLRLPHADFLFSRNVLAPSYTRPTAFHSWSEGIACVDSAGCTVWHLASERVIWDKPEPSATRLNAAKAYWQTVYDEVGRLNK